MKATETNGFKEREWFRRLIDVLSPCIDNYIYLCDINNNRVSTSANALDRFPIPAVEIYDIRKACIEFVYPEDHSKLLSEIEEVLSKKKTFHDLQYRLIDKGGNPVWIHSRGQVIFSEEGEPKYILGCVNEIGRKQTADNASGLLGEYSLREEVAKLEKKELSGFVLRIGIDNFKEINENQGMGYGDMIIRETARCIGNNLLPKQKLYRMVADEFIVLDTSGRTSAEARQSYLDIRRNVDAFIERNGYETFYTVSGGILELEELSQSEDPCNDMMKWTEFALHAAKRVGKNECRIFSREEYRISLEKRELINILRRSVNEDCRGFVIYYQAIVDVNRKEVTGAEALLRFYSEETGFLLPYKFLPLLEESGLIIPVGKWIIHQVMRTCSLIRKTIPDFRININLSCVQIQKSDILAELCMGMQCYGLERGSIVVELTESGMLEKDDKFQRFRDGLEKNGIPLSLDDFGTGYSNFHYLYNLKPETIKIDRSFTEKAMNNNHEYRLIQVMAEMLHNVGLKICIEGIETSHEVKRIQEVNPDYIQGFFYGKPCALEEFLDTWIHKEKHKIGDIRDDML